MKQKIKLLTKYLFLFCVGGLIYMAIELIWRQRTHWTMGVLGGVCFIQIGLINELIPWDMPIIRQALIGATVVTVDEFLAGLLLNVWLGLDIWDYSNLPFNIMGQVCLLFFFLWIFLSLIAIVLDDYLRYKFFGEEQPRYLFGKRFITVPFK